LLQGLTTLYSLTIIIIKHISRAVKRFFMKEGDFLKANMDVRNAVKEHGFLLWQLAEALGMQDSNLSKKLRRELSPQEKERYFKTIETMTAQRNGGEQK